MRNVRFSKFFFPLVLLVFAAFFSHVFASEPVAEPAQISRSAATDKEIQNPSVKIQQAIESEKRREKAEKGDLDAQVYMGGCYEYGWDGVRKDFDKAEYWYRKAAEQNQYIGLTNLALLMYKYGRGTPEDRADLVGRIRRIAEGKNPKPVNEIAVYREAFAMRGIQYDLGLFYRDGFGVKQDYQEAVRWFEKASHRGVDTAQIALGDMYRHGLGVQKDYNEALRWYKKAAMQQNFAAEILLGKIYATGEGVPQDFQEAHVWLSEPANLYRKENADLLQEVKSHLNQQQMDEAIKRRNAIRWNTSYGAFDHPQPPEFVYYHHSICDQNYRNIDSIYWVAVNAVEPTVQTPPWPDIERNIQKILTDQITAKTKSPRIPLGIPVKKTSDNPEKVLTDHPAALYLNIKFFTTYPFTYSGSHSHTFNVAVNETMLGTKDNEKLVQRSGSLFTVEIDNKWAKKNGWIPNNSHYYSLQSYFLGPREALTNTSCKIIANTSHMRCTPNSYLGKIELTPMQFPCN